MSGTVSPDTPLYSIGVTSMLSGLHPQTLRQYDRLGLVVPVRTPGGTRFYSKRDLSRLQQIVALSLEGVNLLGIARILALETDNAQLRNQRDGLLSKLEHLETSHQPTAIVVWRQKK